MCLQKFCVRQRVIVAENKKNTLKKFTKLFMDIKDILKSTIQ